MHYLMFVDLSSKFYDISLGLGIHMISIGNIEDMNIISDP